mmetsp:Transcript_13169/g.30789  ORF Transcript_13169/g.30789 Transcript_13169/m.30789 type:complete len:134 (-) Transcript_13169:118-519(-)
MKDEPCIWRLPAFGHRNLTCFVLLVSMNRFGMSGAESLVRRREAAVAVTSSGETLRSQVDGEHQEMGNTGGPVESMNLACRLCSLADCPGPQYECNFYRCPNTLDPTKMEYCWKCTDAAVGVPHGTASCNVEG